MLPAVNHPPTEREGGILQLGYTTETGQEKVRCCSSLPNRPMQTKQVPRVRVTMTVKKGERLHHTEGDRAKMTIEGCLTTVPRIPTVVGQKTRLSRRSTRGRELEHRGARGARGLLERML